MSDFGAQADNERNVRFAVSIVRFCGQADIADRLAALTASQARFIPSALIFKNRLFDPVALTASKGLGERHDHLAQSVCQFDAVTIATPCFRTSSRSG